MFARTTALVLAATLALPAAGQKLSISSQQAEGRIARAEGGTSGANPVNLSSLGQSLGDWVDPSLNVAGSMNGMLFDATGAHRFDLAAVLTETPVAGFQPRKRYGSISGALAAPGQTATIVMSGSWRLDTYTNNGDFKTTLYMQGPTPMAPLLLLGSMDGLLRRPQAQVKSAPSGGSGSSAGGSGSKSGKILVSSQKTASRSALEGEGRDRRQLAPAARVQRSFVGRWSMPSM